MLRNEEKSEDNINLKLDMNISLHRIVNMSSTSQPQISNPPQSNISPKNTESVAYVFQCRQCYRVISDSHSWLAALNETGLKLIVVSSVVPDSLKRSKEISISNSQDTDIDRGSTYTSMACAVCSKLLGRFYLTTTPAMDFARGHYALYAEDLQFYSVGKSCYSSTNVEDAIKELLKPEPSQVVREMAVMESLIIELYGELKKISSKVEELEKKTNK